MFSGRESIGIVIAAGGIAAAVVVEAQGMNAMLRGGLREMAQRAMRADVFLADR